MTLFLDGAEYTDKVKRRGYSVFYKKVLGPNSFTTLDGTFHEDVLAKKSVVSVPLNPMTSEDLAAFTKAVHNVKVARFFDSETGMDITKTVSANLSVATVLMDKNGKKYWGDELTLTLEEK